MDTSTTPSTTLDEQLGMAEERHQDAMLGLCATALHLHRRVGIAHADLQQLTFLDELAGQVAEQRLALDRLREQKRHLTAREARRNRAVRL